MVDPSGSFRMECKFYYIIISIYPLNDWGSKALEEITESNPRHSRFNWNRLLRAISEFQVTSKDEGSLSSQGNLLKCLTIPTGKQKALS